MKMNLNKNKLIAFMLAGCSMIFCNIDAKAQFFYDESCKGKSGIFQLNGDAKYTGGSIDPDGDGWLRLTPLNTYQLGYVITDKSFPAISGVTIEFDFKVHGKLTGGQGDGFCVFLINSKKSAGKFTQGGAAGGGLGFADGQNKTGARPTYIGVGIDEYGNFSNKNEGLKNGPRSTVHAVVIGTGSIAPKAADRYYYLIGTLDSIGGLGKTVSYPPKLSYSGNRPDDYVYYRRIRIDFEPFGTGLTIKVGMKMSINDTNYKRILTYNYVAGSPAFVPRPDTMSVGFSASTGGAGAVHEVRNVMIRTPGALQVRKDIPAGCIGKNTAIKTEVLCNTGGLSGVSVVDTLPAGYVFNNTPAITNATLVGNINRKTLADGRSVYSFNINIPANTTSTIEYKGHFSSVPAVDSMETAVEIIPPQGFIDDNLADNHAKVKRKVTYLDRIMPLTENILYHPGKDTSFLVTGSTGATYSWEYSTDMGATWTFGGNGDYYRPPTSLFDGRNIFVKCTGKWQNGCTDVLNYQCGRSPDNIIDASCFITPPPSPWTFREAFRGTQTIYNYISPLAGDIDGDGITEIIVSDIKCNKIYIYKGNNLSATPRSISTVSYRGESGAPYAVARWNGRTYLAVTGSDRFIYMYDLNSGKQIWKSSETVRNKDVTIAPPAFADFNADGKPEVYAGHLICDIATGAKIAYSPGNSGYSFNDGVNVFRPIAADVDNDNILEYVVGNEVYKIDVKNKSMSLIYKISGKTPTSTTGGSFYFGDGETQVVDWDGDGRLDIVVSKTDDTGKIYIYIWDAVTQTAKAWYVTDKISGDPKNSAISILMLGDLDGDKQPEMVFVTQERLNIIKHNPAMPGNLEYMYLKSTDKSGFTGAVLFDFNQDNISEIVYRDETDLRIINASFKSHITGRDTSEIYNLQAVPLYSATWGEYPIVVDIDNDGASEIVTVGGDSPSAYDKGTLRVYKSGNKDAPWASSRPVWNQYSYNPVYINQDLTIPAIPLNPALIMPGANGLLGDADDVQPFNNFLQQQTILTKNGVPQWIVPRMEHADPPLYDYSSGKDSLFVHVKITNAGDAVMSPPFYITVYKDSVSPYSAIKTDSIMRNINKDDTVKKVIGIAKLSRYLPFDSLFVRLNDRGNARIYQLECDTTGNNFGENRLVIMSANPDFATVQKYYPVDIDILSNDKLPSSLFTGNFSILDSVTILPKSGELYGTNNGVNSRLAYISTGKPLVNNIDSFHYRFRFHDPAIGAAREAATWAFVYVLDDKNGAASCIDSAYTINLSIGNQNTVFNWYDDKNTPLPGNSNIRTVSKMKSDTSYYIKPVAGNIYGSFPVSKFFVKATDAAGVSLMQWTGQENSDWKNPRNWVEEKILNGRKSHAPVYWSPTSCMNVVIPSGATFYPEPEDSARCKDILLKDRAMLKNPHLLSYRNASVEIKLRPSERDRTLFWSAPLKDMYSGDYRFDDSSQNPNGDIFMSFFQQKNPDYGNSVAKSNHFTATFASLSQPLDIGQSFNIKVVSTSGNKDSLFRFPKSATSYNNSPIRRISHRRFITDSIALDVKRRFKLPVKNGANNNNSGYSILQIVNPYMAHLRIDSFLDNNPDFSRGYYIWNGNKGSGIQTVGLVDGNRYIFTPPNMVTSPDIIPPLQSFLITKLSGNIAKNIDSVNMSPNWTTTLPSTYSLRSGAISTGVLEIKITQGTDDASAMLAYNSSASIFSDKWDMPVIFFDELPLSVYTFSATNEALIINSSGIFDITPIPLGLRTKASGEVKLEFDGLATFGYNVLLFDAIKNKDIDLSISPVYTFSVDKAKEINDRFFLKITRKGSGQSNPCTAPSPTLIVKSFDGLLHISSPTNTIRSMEVYDVVGRKIFYDNNLNINEYTLQVPSPGMYTVKAWIDGKIVVAKAISNM
jgi:hypothetical protein